MALDRLKRTFSFQAAGCSPSGSFSFGSLGGSNRSLASSLDHGDATIAEVDVTMEKASARRAAVNGIPETIPEEEAERIRRESLKPVNGDVARVDSIDGEEGEEGGGDGEGGSGGGKERGEEGDTESSGSKQKRDEGLGESFDRNSELSDRDSVSKGNVVEMQPVGDKDSSKQPPSSSSPADFPASPLDAAKEGQGASPEDPRLSFLDSSASKKVTFM